MDSISIIYIDVFWRNKMKLDETYVIKKYQEGLSCQQIAEQLNTYSKKVERVLKKNGVAIRDKSSAMKLAIENGRSEHPTKGKKRNQESKLAISKVPSS